MNTSILLVEDHQSIAQMVTTYFSDQGYIMDHAKDGLTASHLAVTNSYDLIILDLTLPGIDGISLCQSLRQQCNLTIPIIMLTARDTLEEKISGLNSGADDYMVKPFSILELDARVKSQLRRYQNQVVKHILKIADLEVDMGTLSVKRQHKELSLTPTCFKLLSLLMSHSPAVVSREDIERHIWGEVLPDSDALRSHMYSLRKVVDKPFEKQLIKTHQSNGYQIVT